MKDAPSHMMKFMKKMKNNPIEEVEDESVMQNYRKEVISKKNPQKKKQLKAEKRKAGKKKPSIHKSKQERNIEMIKRVPEIRQRSVRGKIKSVRKTAK
jgi:hypothetical protein